MNANDFTFGIEIECTLPGGLFDDGTIRAGAYHDGTQVDALPAGWNAQRDCSITASVPGYAGVEIVSPILKGAEGLRQVKAVMEQLHAWGAAVNRSCGFHVHVGWPEGRDANDLSKLVNLVANFEKAIYASTGTANREANHYCQSIKTNFKGDRFERNAGNRYHVLNVSNLLAGRKRTVEFRAFAGTLNYSKLVAYVRLCVGLAEKALTGSKKVAWDGRKITEKSGVRRSGKGQTEVCRLFYGVGWTKGRSDRAFGDIAGEDIPDLTDSKRTLMRLAKQYDERTEPAEQAAR